MIYEPREDSFLLERNVKKIARGKKVLDIGSGSGIQAISALKSGAKSVLATDIDEESVKNIRKKGIRAVKSDLFSKIKGEFDLIIFNPPYLPRDEREDKESRLITTGGKIGDELTIKFIKQASKHISKNGEILIVVSSLTPKERMIKAIKKFGLNYESIDSEKVFMEKLEVWKIY